MGALVAAVAWMTTLLHRMLQLAWNSLEVFLGVYRYDRITGYDVASTLESSRGGMEEIFAFVP